jgi:phospholipid N-methyltransferase
MVNISTVAFTKESVLHTSPMYKSKYTNMKTKFDMVIDNLPPAQHP